MAADASGNEGGRVQLIHSPVGGTAGRPRLGAQSRWGCTLGCERWHGIGHLTGRPEGAC